MATSKQQREIEDNLNNDLARVGKRKPRLSMESKARRRRDTDAFIIPIEWVKPDPDQARTKGKSADDPDVIDMAESIKDHGQLQAIEVKELVRDQLYQIVTGEGRYTAMSQILELTEIRVTLVSPDEEQIVWRQLHENIHRRAMHGFDIAKAVDEAMEGGLKLAEVAKKLGKSESWVQKARTVGSDLTDAARELLEQGSDKPSVDTAYEIATVAPELQEDIARDVVESKLTRDELRQRTKAAKRDGKSHRTGRTGRKAAKKPFELKWKDASGIQFLLTSRKKNISDEQILAAAEAFVESRKPVPAKRAA